MLELRGGKIDEVFFRCNPKIPVILIIMMTMLIKKGCVECLAYVLKCEEKELKDTLVVCTFVNIFPKDLLGLPPKHEVKFSIEILRNFILVSKASYHKVPTKLHELKE